MKEVIETQARNATDILKRLRCFIEKRDSQRQPESLAKLIADALAPYVPMAGWRGSW
jgi:hypothetical protein